MEFLAWPLALFLMLAGLVGTVVPLLPGAVLILAGAVLHRVLLGPELGLSWWNLIGLTVLMLLAQIVDFVSGSVGARFFGATRLGAIGGIIGGIVGIFFFPLGIFLGPIIGVAIGELLGGKALVPAAKSTWGTLLGTTAGIIGKLVIALAMIAWFLVAALS